VASFRQPSILPGFGLTLGFTTFFLSVVVLVPLAALVFKGSAMTWDKFISTAARSARRRVLSADFRRRLARGAGQCVLRLHRRLDARALRVSRDAGSSMH
jgi:sulfate transport system permease protein